MKKLEVDLNKLSDDGLRAYLVVKQEMEQISLEEIQNNIREANKGWQKQATETSFGDMYDEHGNLEQPQ